MDIMSKINLLLATSKDKQDNPGVDFFVKALKDGKVKKYKKFGIFEVEYAKKEREVVTKLDGKVETKNTAKVGDAIVTGPKGEKYVLTPEKLKARYKFVSKTKTGEKWEASGECYAVKYTGEKMSFIAPWGERMLCEKGDMIASTKDDGTDVYRIEKEVFKQTYK